jgi:hypothetical protein
MPNKTRKYRKPIYNNSLEEKNMYAKNGTQLKCLMKSCKAQKYKSVYGSTGGSIRSELQLFSS